MKAFGLLGLLVLSLVSPKAMAAKAICVGGPRAPSYAFRSYREAQECARQIAGYGKACAQAVKVASCGTSHQSIGNVRPCECRCNPGYWIGSWLKESCSAEADRDSENEFQP